MSNFCCFAKRKLEGKRICGFRNVAGDLGILD